MWALASLIFFGKLNNIVSRNEVERAFQRAHFRVFLGGENFDWIWKQSYWFPLDDFTPHLKRTYHLKKIFAHLKYNFHHQFAKRIYCREKATNFLKFFLLLNYYIMAKQRHTLFGLWEADCQNIYNFDLFGF